MCAREKGTITITTIPLSVANAHREAPFPTRDKHILAGTQKRRPTTNVVGTIMIRALVRAGH